MVRISMSKYYLLFSSIVFSRSISSFAEDSLKLVQVVFRHGERTPHHSYPNNPIQEFPGGFDELTNHGKKQAYDLGSYLRRRYATFLNCDYKKREIYVRSSDADRCIMTALSVLASLYPPGKSELWDLNLPWQPIPVHTVPEKDDKLLRKEGCIGLKEMQTQVENSKEVQEILEKNRDFIEYLVNNSGISGKSLSSLAHLYDTLLYHKAYGGLPDWVNVTVFDRLKTLADFVFSSRYMIDNLPVLMSGRLLRKITDNMEMKKERSKALKAKKIFLYSTHDNTVGALLKLLGLFNNKMIPYNFAVIFELHAVNNKYYVQILTRDSLTERIHTFTLPQLGDYFTFSDFINKIINRIPDNKSLDNICQTPCNINTL